MSCPIVYHGFTVFITGGWLDFFHQLHFSPEKWGDVRLRCLSFLYQKSDWNFREHLLLAEVLIS